MAMDKEKLLNYFQDHYLSRQEVLFKLPLNYSIDAFWPELLARRKNRATLLPLYNASGMPYWYVLTPGMISASERLCEEAIGQDSQFDPYRAEMTSAMTEEMFFTSFVEGAQIPLQAAMDFLQRGTEPESIQEQMIWNNRHAWSEMVSAIYRPLDEQFIKSLAFMLTEEMDGCATDYRQTDNHMIAAMNAEPYDVLPAYCIPDRMNQLYDFLQFGETHPLIKASAAQAYLLVTRPFPEGNERLSRMISSAVLLRSGYDFFRDISISSVIAKENYRYYKSMCEIIRPENGGDMTYFMEYYLELLVRAIDQRKERIRRREQEALARDREKATMPLSAMTPVQETALNYFDYIPSEDELEEEEKRAAQKAEEKKELPTRRNVHMAREGVLIDPLPEKEYLKIIDQMKTSRHAGNREIPGRIRKMISEGLYTFSVSQWATANGIERKAADVDCRKLYDKGLVDRSMDETVLTYSLQIRRTPTPDPTPPKNEKQGNGGEPEKPKVEETAGDADFWERVMKYENSQSENKRKVGAMIRDMANRGFYEFTPTSMQEMIGLDKDHCRRQCDTLVQDRMIINLNPGCKNARYRLKIGISPNAAEPGKPSAEMMERVRSLGYDSTTDRDQRIGRFLLKLMEQGTYHFMTEDWEKHHGISNGIAGNDIRRALNLGLISKRAAPTGGNQCFYTINMNISAGVRTNDLTNVQKLNMTKMYVKFNNKTFTVDDAAKELGITPSSANFHLMNFVERGMLTTEREPGGPHHLQFAVTPSEHPECFNKPSSVISRIIAQQSGRTVAAV